MLACDIRMSISEGDEDVNPLHVFMMIKTKLEWFALSKECIKTLPNEQKLKMHI